LETRGCHCTSRVFISIIYIKHIISHNSWLFQWLRSRIVPKQAWVRSSLTLFFYFFCSKNCSCGNLKPVNIYSTKCWRYIPQNVGTSNKKNSRSATECKGQGPNFSMKIKYIVKLSQLFTYIFLQLKEGIAKDPISFVNIRELG